MPDKDAPPISGILDQDGAPSSAAVVALHMSKRPREEDSPLPGKRGKGENGEIAVTLQITMPTPGVLASPAGGGGTAPPPLCESPSKINQASHKNSSSKGFSPFSAGAGTAKIPFKEGSTLLVTAAAPIDALAGAANCPAARRKIRAPPAASPSLAATDPVFHAALLRLLHRRGGKTCPEAVGWRWCGDTPARFDHWPCTLHPSVMDLLACVSAVEERVVLTGCDVKEKDCGRDDDTTHPPPPPRTAAWRAPRPRTPTMQVDLPPPPAVATVAMGEASDSAPPATPDRVPIAASSLSASCSVTPYSALRRPGSTRCRSSNRVRFNTHDLTVVDTPDPARDGSEEGMISALGGLQSILSAAERVRRIAGGEGRAAGSSNNGGIAAFSEGGGAMRHQRAGQGHYEGYFDRFSSAGQSDRAVEPAADAAAVSSVEAAVSSGSSIREQGVAAEGSEARQEEEEGEGGGDAVLLCAAAETKSVSDDAVAIVGILDEMASSDDAPEEINLAGGWGPEHSNAAAFYAKELSTLCRVREGAARAATAARGASQLRGRYLDVLSCLVRYNLKLLLNVCVCDVPEAEEDHSDSHEAEVIDATDAGGENSSTAGLTVTVPGRTALLREQQGLAVGDGGAWAPVAPARGGCGCVTVLDGTGALEFNTEDVAALLTLALARVHPFVPLAAMLTVAAEAGWEGDAVAMAEDGDASDDGDTCDDRVWAAVQLYTMECRAAAAASASAAASRRTGLFSGTPAVRLSAAAGDASSGAAATADAPSEATPAGVSCTATDSEDSASSSSALTVDEAADLLEYVAATRFIAQLLSEPVVAAGVSTGRWSYAERLAQQVRKLAEAHESAAAGTAASPAAGFGDRVTPSLGNMLCLGALADVRGLGVAMAQQARYAPALEATLKGELRRALRRGQGSRQRRLKSRLQQAPRGAPDVFGFPLVKPCCCLGPGGGMM